MLKEKTGELMNVCRNYMKMMQVAIENETIMEMFSNENYINKVLKTIGDSLSLMEDMATELDEIAINAKENNEMIKEISKVNKEIRMMISKKDREV